jgi:DNA-binding LytR/AlgR family response regulator
MKNQIMLCPRLQLKQPIYLEEIVLLEAMCNYTMVYLRSGKTILTSQTLQRFDDQFPDNVFWRISRNFLVKAPEIVKWERMPDYALQITLTNGKVLSVSRRKKSWMKVQLNQFFNKNV